MNSELESSSQTFLLHTMGKFGINAKSVEDLIEHYPSIYD